MNINNLIFKFFLFILSGCNISLLPSNRSLQFITLHENIEIKNNEICSKNLKNFEQIRIDKITVDAPYNSYRIFANDGDQVIKTVSSIQWASSLSNLYTHRVRRLINSCDKEQHALPIFTIDITSKSKKTLDISLIHLGFTKIEGTYHAFAHAECSLRNEISGQLYKISEKKSSIKLDESIDDASSIKEMSNAIDQVTLSCLSNLIEQ